LFIWLTLTPFNSVPKRKSIHHIEFLVFVEKLIYLNSKYNILYYSRIFLKMPNREPIFLLGNMKHQITGSKLLSIGDCLQVLFFNMRISKLNLNESAFLVVDECIVFGRWQEF